MTAGGEKKNIPLSQKKRSSHAGPKDHNTAPWVLTVRKTSGQTPALRQIRPTAVFTRSDCLSLFILPFAPAHAASSLKPHNTTIEKQETTRCRRGKIIFLFIERNQNHTHTERRHFSCACLCVCARSLTAACSGAIDKVQQAWLRRQYLNETGLRPPTVRIL